VEEMIVTDGGQPRRIDVPVEVPEGMNRAAVFDPDFGAAPQSGPVSGRNFASLAMLNAGTANAQTRSGTSSSRSKSRRTVSAGSGSGIGTGAGGGGGRAVNGNAGNAASSPPPNAAMTVTVTAASTELDAAYVMPKPSPEELRREQLRTKIHPSILAVIERLKKKDTNPSAEEARFIRNGKAELQIWLTDKSDEALAKLKELGFEVVLDPKTSKLVIGRLPIEKLEALADLKFVRYIAPQKVTN